MLTDAVQGVGEQDLEDILELNAAAEDSETQEPSKLAKPQDPKPRAAVQESKVQVAVVNSDQLWSASVHWSGVWRKSWSKWFFVANASKPSIPESKKQPKT